jgi:ribosome recycling factor
MHEEIEFIIDTAKEAMNNAIEHLIKELRSIRAGKGRLLWFSNTIKPSCKCKYSRC